MDNLMSMPGQPDDQPGNLMSMAHSAVVSAGQNALKTKSVSQVDAAKQALALGVGDPDVLKSILNGKTKYNYETLRNEPIEHVSSGPPGNPPEGTAIAANPPPPAPPVKPQSRTKTISSTIKSPEENAREAEGIKNALGMNEETNPSNDLNSAISMMAGMVDPNAGWTRPLAGLADYVSSQSGNKGTSLASFTPQGLSPAEAMQTMLKYKDELAKRKDEQAKLVAQYMGRQQPGKTEVNIGDLFGGGANGSGFRSLAPIQNSINAIGAHYDTDTVIKPALGISNRLSNAEANLNGNALLNASSLNDAYQSYIQALNGANQATEGRMQRDIPPSLANTINSLYARFGKVKDHDLRNDSMATEAIEALRAQIAQTRNEYSRYVNEAGDRVHVNYETQPDFMPQAYKDAINQANDKKRDFLRKAFPYTPQVPSGIASPKGGAGRTKALTDMSKAELDAYEASLTKGG